MQIAVRRLRRAARRRLEGTTPTDEHAVASAASRGEAGAESFAQDPQVAAEDARELGPRRGSLGLFTPVTERMSVRSSIALVVIVALIGGIALIHHLDGVDWGDDFALYLRQAKALTTGGIDDVVRDNRFSLENSGWHTFSPLVYPWGWPLLLAPVYAVVGLDYEVFKGLEVVALCIYLLVFFAIVRRRTGPLPAGILTLLIGLSPAYISHTGTVLSDLPFLCFVGLSLWWIDRCRAAGLVGGNRIRLAALGLLVAYTFNIRPEGISLLAALIALHVAVLGGMALRARPGEFMRSVRWSDALLPYLTLSLGILAFQVFLPGDLLPSAPGTGLENVSPRLGFYQDILAEHVGVKDAGLPMSLFGSEGAARAVLLVIVLLAVIGVVARLIDRFTEDVTLAAYLGSASVIMLVSPYQEGRYLLSITPLLIYFAYQALPTVVRVVSATRVVRPVFSLVPALAFAGLLGGNLVDVARTVDYHMEYEYTVNGPKTPAAEEMLSIVRRQTQEDDVILFFRARAMTFYTDRRAIQGSNLDDVLDTADWYVMAKGSTYSQHLVSESEAPSYGLMKRWENAEWVLWEVERA